MSSKRSRHKLYRIKFKDARQFLNSVARGLSEDYKCKCVGCSESCLLISLLVPWADAPTIGDVFKAVFPVAESATPPLEGLKHIFSEEKWKLLKRMNRAMNKELHSELDSEVDGTIRFVTKASPEVKTLFQEIALTSHKALLTELLDVVTPESDSSGNGSQFP